MSLAQFVALNLALALLAVMVPYRLRQLSMRWREEQWHLGRRCARECFSHAVSRAELAPPAAWQVLARRVRPLPAMPGLTPFEEGFAYQLRMLHGGAHFQPVAPEVSL